MSPQGLGDIIAKWLPKEINTDRKTPAQAAAGDAAKPLPTANAASKANPAVWDRDLLLNRVMGDRKMAERIMDEFIKAMPGDLEALDRLLAADDGPGVLTQVHSIKGAVTSLGGMALGALAFEMEKAARAGNLAAVKARMGDLRAAFEHFKDATAKG